MATATAAVTTGVEFETERLTECLSTATTDMNITTAATAHVVPETETNHDGADIICGTIVRKRKYRDNVSLAIRTAPTLENAQQQPPELVMVPRSDQQLEGCFPGTLVEVRLEPAKQQEIDKMNTEGQQQQSQSRETQKQNTHRKCKSLRVLRSSPDPNAIQVCLKLVSEGKLPLEVFSRDPPGTSETNAGILLLKDLRQAGEILSMGPKDPLRKALVKRLSVGLKGEPIDETEGDEGIVVRPRKRPTHVKLKQRKILEKLEASQSPLDPIRPLETMPAVTDGESDNESETAAAPPTATPLEPLSSETLGAVAAPSYNLPDPNDPTLMSGRHPKTRREYLHDKKWPQIRWLLRRLVPIVQRLRELRGSDHRLLELLDVGGGRGDLAVAVAEAFSDVRVTVVDLNESSLEGGRAYYQSRKPANETEERVVFVCGDFAEYARGGFSSEDGLHNENTNNDTNATLKPRKFDAVVAWHACGDLSDYALEFAVRDTGANANAFVICPCCYTKRYIASFEPKWIGDYTIQEQQRCLPCAPLPVNNNNNDGESKHDPKSNISTSQIDSDIKTIQRLAEINERPEITHRAMGLINTMRLRSLLTLSSSSSSSQQQQQMPTFDITLEEYDLSYSSKNLVLVGIKK
jgi:hypothetical protein